MLANFSDQLRRAISHERLDAYRQRGMSSVNAELFAHYAWNMELINWVNPAMRQYVEPFDRFTEVFNNA